MKLTIYLFLLFSFVSTLGQRKDYPKDYFRSPLDIPLILSGTFGELRSNHFHSGLDIKTQGRQGLPIYAIADGYVSRIKVSQYGFGKALYITHPNGYTSVYAHLQKYADTIQKYVKHIQYKKESYYTGNLFFKEDKFPVKNGEIVAYSGDTGGSGGPHLHFEIRDTKTEKVINPLHFGYKVLDNRNPTIQAIKAYPLSNYAQINGQKRDFQITVKPIAKGKYVTSRITANGSIGFGISTFDRLNFAPNKNGVYSIEMLVNGKSVYYFDVETFAFSESKFINLHIDYKHFQRYRRRYQKTFKENANRLSLYEKLMNKGVIEVKNGMSYTVKIIVKDFQGNSSEVSIPVQGVNSVPLFVKPIDSTAFFIDKSKFHSLKEQNVTVAFPKNTFYKNQYLDFSVENKVAKIHTPTVPLDKNYTIRFNITNHPEEDKEYLYIANLENSRYPRYQSTKRRDSVLYTTTKTLGKYGLRIDKEPPKVRLLYFKDQQWITKFKTLKVRISDRHSGIKNYRATIDGKWILMEFNHKRGILTYNFNDKKLEGTKHIFKIVVSDNVGNTKELSATFFKK